MNCWIKICLLLTAAPLMLSTPAAAVAIKGKATVNVEPVAGVEVMAYPAAVLNFEAPPPHVSARTAADGLFNLELPAGQYYLLARGPQMFSFYGRNPLTVPAAGLQDVNLLMTPDNLPGPELAAGLPGGVVGYVTLDGQPQQGAIVTVYPDLSSQLKGIGLGMAAPTDRSGSFQLPLSPGSYYLLVRVRQNGQMAGPLGAGDLFGYFHGNPLVIRANEPVSVHLPLIEVPGKVDRHAASMFGETLITGRVLDRRGAPVAGIQVLLYDDSSMLNRPLYVSRKTAADGGFQLSFPQGGRYYLAARDELGGTPAPGELYGRYQGSADNAIEITTGKVLEGIEIVVDEVY